MTSAHHEEVGRRVGAAGAGDSSSSRGPGRSGVRLGCRREEKASFPLPKQLNLGVGRRRQLKKKKKRQARDLFFSSISLVTGSP